MSIRSVNEFISAVGGDLTGPSGGPSTPSYENPVHWGPPTSLAGQDAFSRMGLDVGMPKAASMYKTSAAFHGATQELLSYQRHTLVKEAMVGAALANTGRAGLQVASKYLGRLLPGLLRGGANAGKSTISGIGRLAKTPILPKGTTGSRVMSEVPGFMTDAMSTAYDVNAGLSHKPSSLSRVMSAGQG